MFVNYPDFRKQPFCVQPSNESNAGPTGGCGATVPGCLLAVEVVVYVVDYLLVT